MLTKEDFEKAAEFLGCEPEVIQAVTEVEAPKGAFDDLGRLTILFEAHVFWRELKKKGIDPKTHVKGNENILSSTWNSKLYGKFSAQWARLEKAALIDRDSAYRSASYGAFQIMGNNAESLGYNNVHAFVANEKLSVQAQLTDFCRFIKANNLDDELRKKDWAAFAKRYNGPSYATNQYDKKLKQAYDKLKKS